MGGAAMAAVLQGCTATKILGGKITGDDLIVPLSDFETKAGNEKQTFKSNNKIQIMEYITNYNGQNKTQIVLDRTRTVNYNGAEIQMNIYKCSDCKKEYFFEEVKHEICPLCGCKYKFKTDVSI